MPEPSAAARRPITMKRLLLSLPALLAGAALLAACGSAPDSRSNGSVPGSGSASGAGPSSSASPTAATTCRPPVGGMPAVLASVDLDGDGTPESPYVLGAHDHVCPNHLFATVGGKGVALDLGPVALQPHATAIQVPGRTGQVIVARQLNPRGGYQVHLYGYADGALAEITSQGRPLVPFVATDTPQGTPLTATCVQGGISVTLARTHQPIGVAAAYDLYRTTYTIDGNTATAGTPEKVADNVLPAQLKQKYAALAGDQLFTNCTAATIG